MNVVKDLYLVASNSSRTPKGPSGYEVIGAWDVDSGGAKGTGRTRGTYKMGLFANIVNVRSLAEAGEFVESVFLTASNSSRPSKPPSKEYEIIGYWDVDDGGAVGTNGSRGKYMMSMYIRKSKGGNSYISDIMLTASNSRSPKLPRNKQDYTLSGYWDADSGGAVGTHNDKGSFMMGLFTRYSLA